MPDIKPLVFTAWMGQLFHPRLLGGSPGARLQWRVGCLHGSQASTHVRALGQEVPGLVRNATGFKQRFLLGKSMVKLGKSMVKLGKSMVKLGKSMVKLGKSMVKLGKSMELGWRIWSGTPLKCTRFCSANKTSVQLPCYSMMGGIGFPIHGL